MKKIFILTLIIAFCLPNFVQSQVIEGTKTKAIKQATVKISELEQISDKDKVVMKVPNPHWEIPEWTYNKTNVIFKQPASEIQTSRAEIRETSPLPDTTFAGLMDNGTSIPPDVHGARS